MSRSAVTSNRRIWLLIIGTVGVLIAVACYYYPRKVEPNLISKPVEPADFPLPPISSSSFLNTRAGVGYVGSEKCRSCHHAHYSSFRRTSMGKSMDLVDLEREPPDGTFDHPQSKQRFQVVRKDGKILHRQLLVNGSEELILSEYPVKYVVGSGHYSFTYLIETEGFLAESPMTWYASQRKWGISPGYDHAHHEGFGRDIDMSCLFCHVGKAEAIGDSVSRIDVKEPAIGCERCHGPGALHVERHALKKARDAGASEIDPTIVNPVHLSRSLSEAICQYCHLSSSVSILVRGRKFDDFRPGLPLQDFRHDFTLEEEGSNMTVVGHVEQMHLSRCYKEDKTFSCLTCHDPHHEPPPKNRESYFKNICLKCHQAEKCKVDPAVRHKKEPGNNCVQCHMPTGPTDIPHLAFTHHRVGIHDQASFPRKTGPTVMSKLEPILDLSAVSDMDLKLSLGQGYFDVAEKTQDPKLKGQYQERGLNLFAKVRSAGLRDGILDFQLTLFNFPQHPMKVLEHAQKAEKSGSLRAQQRYTMLFLAAETLVRDRQFKEAIPKLRMLTTMRRDERATLMLASCEKALGDPGYVASLENAVRINPRLWQVHKTLAEHFRNNGDPAKADYHEKRSAQ